MIPKILSVGERLTLSHCQTETFKAGTLSLSVVLPIRRESTYLTSLLLSVLLRGTETYPDVASLNRRLDYLYGTELSIRNFYRGDHHVIGLSASLLDAAYLPKGEGKTLICDVLEVLRELLFCPLRDADGCLEPKYVEREKLLQCDTIRAQKNHPHAYAADRARKLMYADEPAGVPIYGSIEEVMAATPEQLTSHWETLLRDLQLEVFYVGSADCETVSGALAKTLLPHLPTAPKKPLPKLAPIAPAKSIPVRTEETMPINQGHLMIGLRTGCRICDPDFYACTLLNELLGASPVSKLFVNVRERHSLCYSCASTYNGYKGTILISCGLCGENRDIAEQEIFKQLSDIAEGRIIDAEWEAALHSLSNAYRQLSDHATAIESYWFGRRLSGLWESPEESLAKLSRVKREDVIALGARLMLDTVFFLRETGGGEEETDEEN